MAPNSLGPFSGLCCERLPQGEHMAEQTLFGYRLRPHQQQVLAYEGGRMAVSAVPGSGKTLTLALLAARLIVEGHIGELGEVLVVTVQNSAVDNISARIRRILVEQRLPPVGYHVCTLHKLAADILRGRRDLAGVDDQFAIVDEIETGRMIHTAVDAWTSSNNALWLSFLPDPDPTDFVKSRWRGETERIGREVAKLCKHLRLTPAEASSRLEGEGLGVALARMGVALYTLYEQYLRARAGLDFDDLIWRATDAIEQDGSFLAALRAKWPYILEDEAQDSSPLQETILDSLAGEDGNWVRVGDPNQAINSTFTAADPRFFRAFLGRADISYQALLESGRCARPLMAMADALAYWGAFEHPTEAVRGLSFEPQRMQATGEGDPQPNPPDEACTVHIARRPYDDVKAEAQRVASWAANYVKRHPDETVAILCPAGWQGSEVVQALETLPDVPFDDMLRTTPQVRNVARLLAKALQYLADPTHKGNLIVLYRALVSAELLPARDEGQPRRLAGALGDVALPELLYPRGTASVEAVVSEQARLREGDIECLGAYVQLVRRWVSAVHLPPDQLILTISQDLFSRPEEERSLALCHTIATLQRNMLQLHPEWTLADLSADLDAVANNRRTLVGLGLSDEGYQPTAGRIAVTTMHKAKGLEWDTVYLVCVDDLEFPDRLDGAYRGEPFYLPGHAPPVEARKTLERLVQHNGAVAADPVIEARLEEIAERLRLLYVGVTRARRNLSITYAQKNGSRDVRPALAIEVLEQAYRRYFEEREA